ncbi:MAG: glycerol-phosphate dehydrogenase, partial [Humisphaera sp.]|nr:glycerol-phosphate dehydrogenase [Humisphaera sp.]
VADALGAETFVFTDSDLHAEWRFVERLEQSLAQHQRIPIAVGAGTINDVVKLAAHRTGRAYLCVATAASMDGYTAYGASITKDGSKQTFDCPAPRAVVADIDIIRAAPNALNASGYADLLAKITAGADWIVAAALGIEPIHDHAWRTVQGGLHAAVADPAGVRRGDLNAIMRLTEGLMMGGFAMQAMQSSRPASGAEHQFSHLWDMQHHVDERTGTAPSHGFKVGIGTLAIARLYERIFDLPIEKLDVDVLVARWPTWEATEKSIRELFDIAELRDKAIEETRAKYPWRDELRAQLTKLRSAWPDLRRRLIEQLIPSAKLATMLAAAGAPTRSEEIGISAERLRKSHRLASHIRRRFTVLDLADRIGLLDA